MRSVIYEPNREGIKASVKQQFEFAKVICDNGLVPIIEPEVDIHAPEKELCESMLKEEIKEVLNNWDMNDKIMFKFTIPTVDIALPICINFISNAWKQISNYA
jgi:fructose-bisphosphate aldolase class I